VTYSDGDWLADLDPTDWEREQVAQALEEVAAEGTSSADWPAEPDGPWHDSLPQLDDAFATMDRAHQLDGVRRAEDIAAQLDRRPSAEDVLARDMRRVEAGTFTEPVYDPYDSAASACDGQLDDFGRCASRFHARDCHQVMEAAAATGDAEAAQAWRGVMLNYTLDPGVQGFELATPAAEPWTGTDAWQELLEAPGGADRALHEHMIAVLGGEAAPQPGPVLPADQRPDTTALRERMGL
jgi:hypothetical protein